MCMVGWRRSERRPAARACIVSMHGPCLAAACQRTRILLQCRRANLHASFVEILQPQRTRSRLPTVNNAVDSFTPGGLADPSRGAEWAGCRHRQWSAHREAHARSAQRQQAAGAAGDAVEDVQSATA